MVEIDRRLISTASATEGVFFVKGYVARRAEEAVDQTKKYSWSRAPISTDVPIHQYM